ncbi:MAG: DUF2092 domain-containing protein [Candidatus Competibacteraceae bacterium]
MHPVIRTLGSGAVLLVALLATAVLAETKSPAVAAPPSSAAMEQLLRMANFLARLEQFSVGLRSGYDVVQESGQKIEFGEQRDMTLVRPNRFRVNARTSDGEASTVVFDGKVVTVFNATDNLYATSELAGDIDAAIAHFVRDLRMRLPLALLFVTALPKEFEQRILGAEIVETTTIADQPYFHLAARGDSVDLQVWLPTTGDPLPHRIILTYKHEEGQPQYWANFMEWNLAPNPSASWFALDIPKEAARIPFLAQVRRAEASPTTKGEEK